MTKGNEVKNRLKEDKDQSSYRVWPEYPLRAWKTTIVIVNAIFL